MQNKVGSMAVEVSGTATGDPLARLEVKKRQVAGCSLPVERLAVVAAFAKPSIMAGSMTDTVSIARTEDELDTLVSIAIRRAGASSTTFTHLRRMTRGTRSWSGNSGLPQSRSHRGSPRRGPVGAVWAALAAGNRAEAERLASKYLAESPLPAERQEAIARVFQEDQERLSQRYPALAKSGRLAELAEWRASVTSQNPRVFPAAA